MWELQSPWHSLDTDPFWGLALAGIYVYCVYKPAGTVYADGLDPESFPGGWIIYSNAAPHMIGVTEDDPSDLVTNHRDVPYWDASGNPLDIDESLKGKSVFAMGNDGYACFIDIS